MPAAPHILRALPASWRSFAQAHRAAWADLAENRMSTTKTGALEVRIGRMETYAGIDHGGYATVEARWPGEEWILVAEFKRHSENYNWTGEPEWRVQSYEVVWYMTREMEDAGIDLSHVYLEDPNPKMFEVRTAPTRFGKHKVIEPARTALAKAKRYIREMLAQVEPPAPEPSEPEKPSLPPQLPQRWQEGDAVPAQGDLLSPRAKEALRVLVERGSLPQDSTEAYHLGLRHDRKKWIEVQGLVDAERTERARARARKRYRGDPSRVRPQLVRAVYAEVKGEDTVLPGPAALYALSLPDKKEAKAIKAEREKALAREAAEAEQAKVRALPAGLRPDAIRETFEPHREEAREEYRRFMRSLVQRLRKQHGPLHSDLRRVQGDARTAVMQARRVLRPGTRDDEYEIDPALLDEEADRFASAVLDAMQEKIIEKVGGLLYPALTLRGGGEFLIRGELPDGTPVRVEQQRILKVSPNGKWFHQWPARIYVAGTFTPAADYAKILAERGAR